VRARLVPLGALVLFSAGCGAETVASDESGRKTGRIETLSRYTAAGAETHEFRSTATYDFVKDRSTYADPASGCRTITIGDQSYTEVPEAVDLPGGKRWVRYDGGGFDLEAEFEETLQDQTRTTSDGTVVSESSMILFATAGPGPERYLDYLRESSKEQLELLGEDEIRGEPTTHYRGDVDVRRRMREDLEADGWEQANIDRYLAQTVDNDEVVDLWVGEDGLVRRVVTTTQSPPGYPFFESVTTADYVDYGLEANIDTPPAADVLDDTAWQGKVLETNVDSTCLH
jgi:hypothetical protein